jgi:GATA-binding protein
MLNTPISRPAPSLNTHNSGQQAFPSEWGNVFSSPLDPDTFAALAASGILSPLSSNQSSIQVNDTPRSSHLQHSLMNPSHPVDNTYSRLRVPGAVSSGPIPTRAYKSKASIVRLLSFNLTFLQLHTTSKVTDLRQDNTHNQRGPQWNPQPVAQNYSNPDYFSSANYPLERSNSGVHHSLWMSPNSTAPSSPGFAESSSTYSSLSAYTPSSELAPVPASFQDPTTSHAHTSASSSTPTTSASNPKSPVFADLFSEEVQSSRQTTISPQEPFPSRKLSGSPDLNFGENPLDPEAMAKEDPLAARVWKMYAQNKAAQPHAQRMENLTWRMMALALKKKKETEAKKAEEAGESDVKVGGSNRVPALSTQGERGRRIDKGKTKVSVVGFDGQNPDGVDDSE